MSIANDIASMYRRPSAVLSRVLSDGPREDRALAYLMGACALMFVAQLPRLSRESHETGQDLNMLMGGALMGWIFIAPLAFYLIAAIAQLIARVFGGQGSYWAGRMALFWALLAAAPMFLLLGLVQGFIGPGLEANLVGLVWIASLVWFWLSGIRQANRRDPA